MLTALLLAALAADPIPTLLITGQNNHNWRYTSRLHAETLEASGRFAVTITDEPWTTLADAASVARYRLFVLDYNDLNSPRRWGEAAESNFLGAVKAGVGVVVIHAANNAFRDWPEYEKLVGLVWRDGSGHGPFHAFDLVYTKPDHPILAGLPAFRAHPDELYHRLENPQRTPIEVLATAMSATDKGGTGQPEPMALTLAYGAGRVFATPLGHVWVNAQETKASISDPQFKALICRGAEWAATGAVTLPSAWADTRTHNTLSPAERAAGWTLLFDGTTTANWRGYKKPAFPDSGWAVDGGTLWRKPGKGGGDIVSAEQYADFELALDYKVAKGGNSGVIYRATEDHDYCWETGPELQILDDSAHGDSNKGKTRAGAMYDLVALAHDVARPAGEWNSFRVVCQGTRVEHWVNGFKVVDVDTASPEFKAALAQSKWTKYPDFLTRTKGHVALQDHGDEVRFRNIKIRPIAAAETVLERRETDSGLIIEDLRIGTGEVVPPFADLRAHYRGMLADGTQFDSSYDRNEPLSFSLRGGVIKGWLEGIPGMRIGGKRRLIVPPELAYGQRGFIAGGRQIIPPDAMLIFEIEPVEVRK